MTFRGIIARFRKKPVDESIKQEPFPSAEDVIFIEHAEEAFLSAFDGVNMVSKYTEDEAEMALKRNDMERILSNWLFEDLLHFRNRFSEQKRFIVALVNGLEAGDIKLQDFDDLRAFDFVINAQWRIFPQVVEHFLSTGELLELVEFLREESGRFGALFDWDVDSQRDLEASRARAYRLYCYDITRIKEHLKEGRDTYEHTSLPLEVRMEFAGFWDHIGDDERNDVFELDHRDVLSSAASGNRVDSGNMT